jgi:hypothetical protein
MALVMSPYAMNPYSPCSKGSTRNQGMDVAGNIA